MNARQLGGIAPGAALADHERDAGRQPDRSQVMTLAQACGQAPASALQAKPAGPRRPLAPDYSRDSRSRPLAVPRCESSHSSAVPEVAPSDRITDPGIQPKLFNPAEGLTMEKTARAFFYPAMKSFPIKAMLRTPKQIREDRRKPMILRSYTLCEVIWEGGRKSLPLKMYKM